MPRCSARSRSHHSCWASAGRLPRAGIWERWMPRARSKSLTAVGVGGGRSVPDRWQAGGQGPDLLAFGSCQRPGAGGGEAVALLAQLLPLSQRGLPVPFQLPDNQAVLGLGELVLTAGPVGGEI